MPSLPQSGASMHAPSGTRCQHFPPSLFSLKVDGIAKQSTSPPPPQPSSSETQRRKAGSLAHIKKVGCKRSAKIGHAQTRAGGEVRKQAQRSGENTHQRAENMNLERCFPHPQNKEECILQYSTEANRSFLGRRQAQGGQGDLLSPWPSLY